jgi:hypothetical protein
MPTSQPPMPNFLIIGAARAATRWLRFNLNQHPDVYMPPYPLDYFASGVPPFDGPPFGDARRQPREGGRWYRLQFTAAEDQPCVGEASAGYLAGINNPGAVAARIDERLPGVRLIAMVRHPVDRLYSAFARAVQTGYLPVGTDLVDLVEREDPRVQTLDLEGGSRYALLLYPYLKRFGDRLLVLRHDEIPRDPGGVYDDALRHLGLAPGFRPARLDRVLFAGHAEALVPPLDDNLRRILYRRFRADVEELQELLDWDLAQWDPGPPAFSEAASSPDTP